MTGHHAAVRHLPELRLLAPADFLLAEAAPGKRATGLGVHRRRRLALDADGLALFIQIDGRADPLMSFHCRFAALIPAAPYSFPQISYK